MKKINLFVDFEFTSLSPDAQPISVGIVSEEIETNVPVDEIREFDNGTLKLKNHKNLVENGFGMKEFITKSFYAEFSDFDLNRCDDWVKENVVGKLIGKGQCDNEESYSCVYGDTKTIKFELKEWLSLFSDYEIQIVVDCGTHDFYWFLQLVAEWDEVPSMLIINAEAVKDIDVEEILKEWRQGTNVIIKSPLASETKTISSYRIGLPKLPANISPVPFDLNDLIAIKKGISPKEAFDLNREVLAFMNAGDGVIKNGESFSKHCNKVVEFPSGKILQEGMIKHNSLWDAKVIKAIYNKLMNQ